MKLRRCACWAGKWPRQIIFQGGGFLITFKDMETLETIIWNGNPYGGEEYRLSTNHQEEVDDDETKEEGERGDEKEPLIMAGKLGRSQ